MIGAVNKIIDAINSIPSIGVEWETVGVGPLSISIPRPYISGSLFNIGKIDPIPVDNDPIVPVQQGPLGPGGEGRGSGYDARNPIVININGDILDEVEFTKVIERIMQDANVKERINGYQ